MTALLRSKRTSPSCSRRQDGILGVCAGIEMLRVFHEEKVQTEFAVGVVNWTK